MKPEVLYIIQLTQQKKFTPKIIHAHVEHLRRLDDDGKLVIAGPLEGEPSGGMVIVRADSEQEALSIAEEDPFIAQGFESYQVRAMTLSCRENNYLLG